MADRVAHEGGRALQKLTDRQVSARLAAYNPGGAFERKLHALWDEAGDLIEAAVRASGGETAADRTRLSFTQPVDAAWVHAVAALGFEIYTKGSSVPAEMDRRARLVAGLISAFRERFGDLPGFAQAVATPQRLASHESDVILVQVALLEANSAAEARG